ncbi:MAG: hypothetical protein H6598_08545 [Flavobacteriales bacterium]|nr:hypothetical protein [Flavobacteriales bacterium]MCB9196259.1 hypothetical protein [Flavobacteriales bacterium]
MVDTLIDNQVSTLEVLMGKAQHAKEFNKHFVTLFDSGIMLFEIKKDAILTSRDLSETRSWLAHFGQKKYLNMIIAKSRAEVEDDFRLDAAISDSFSIADAIVVNGISQRIMANLYLRFNRPKTPTKVFADQESAAFWLMSFC